MRAAPTPAPAVTLEDIWAEIQALRQLLEEDRRRPTPAPDRSADVVLALASVWGEAVFTARECYANDRLRAACAACRSPRQLGKRFRAIEGQAVGGLVLRAVGNSRDGKLWRVYVA
jgi:hypothetical protein